MTSVCLRVRRTTRLACVAMAAAWIWAGDPHQVPAQPTTAAAPRTTDAAAFLRQAHSLAVLQARAAAIAAARETRPEVRAYAQKMVEFRRGYIPKLEAAARDHKLPLPAVQEFEHQVVLENLEPLDFLALSRRYAELQVQALEQEVRGYGQAETAAEEWLAALARDTRPQLDRLLDEARQVRQAVGP